MAVSGTPVGNMIIKVDLDSVGVEKSMTGLQRQLKSSNKAMGAQLSSFDRSEKSVSKYGVMIDSLSNRHKIQAKMVDEAKKKYEEISSEYGENSVKAQKAAQDLNTQIQRYQETGRELNNLKSEFKDFQRAQDIQSSNWTKMGNHMESFGGKLKGAGTNISNVGSKMTKSITLPAVGATAAVGGLFAAFGWKRLTGLDTAQAKLKGLDYSAKDVERISKDVEQAIEGGMTTFAEGTDIAAGSLAAGVKEGKELQRYIKLVGDAAVGANRPVADMAQIFNRVEGNGKLMTQELNSIEMSMPGFSKAMSKHLGVSSEKFREMVTDGKVSSKDFLNVMDDFAGNMAKEYSKSWDGMVANTKAYVGIIGESFLKGVFEDGKKSLADFIELLKSPEVQRRAQEMGKVAQESFGKMRDSIMGVVSWYQNLDDDQKTMIKRLGLVAVAGGPVLQMTGKLTGGLGSVLEVVGKTSKAIGVARGAGLVAGLSSLGPAAAPALAVAGLAAVAGGAYLLHKEIKKTEEVNLELAQSLSDQATELENSAETFDELSDKAKVSNAELAELDDLNKRISESANPGEIKELQGQYDQLAKNSGLSKDELKRLFGANDEIIEQAPNVQKSISDNGNAFVDNKDDANGAKDAIKEYAQSLRDLSEQELSGQRLLLLAEYDEANEKLDKYKDRLEDIEELSEFIMANSNMSKDDMIERIKKIGDLLEDDALSNKEILELEEERNNLQTLKHEGMAKSYESLVEEKEEIEKHNEKWQKKIDKLDAVEQQMVNIKLQNVGINEEGEKGLEQLDKSIKKNQDKLKELDKQRENNGKLTEEEKKQYDTLVESLSKQQDVKDEIFEQFGLYGDLNTLSDEQRKKLESQGVAIDSNNKKTDAGIKKEQERTKEAGKSVDKKVTAKDHGTVADINKGATEPKIKRVSLLQSGLDEINREASKPVSKTISFIGKGLEKLKFWAKGTPPSGHPGGPAVVGDGGGSELVTLPSGRSFLSPNTDTLLDLPKGTHVVPHRETERIMKSMPRYADGTDGWSSALGNSEFAKLLALNNRSTDSRIVIRENKNNNDDTKEMVMILMEQVEHIQKSNELLTALLSKDLDLYKLNKKVDEGINNISDRRRAAFGG